MNKVTSTGQTVEEAVESALKELETSREHVDIRVIDEGKKGFLGIFGAKPAVVEVHKVFNPVVEAEKFLKNVIEQMGVNASIEKKQQDNQVTFNLSGDKVAILIGKRGQTLNSLQYLTHLVANRYSDVYYSVIVDAQNYRKKRKETLHNLAKRLADKAVRTKREVVLEPMPSYERKIIHASLYHHDRVKTYSKGSEPNRYIVISPK